MRSYVPGKRNVRDEKPLLDVQIESIFDAANQLVCEAEKRGVYGDIWPADERDVVKASDESLV